MPRFRVVARESYWKEYIVDDPRAVDRESAKQLVRLGGGEFITSWSAGMHPVTDWAADIDEDEEEDEEDEEDDEPHEVPTRFVRATRTPVVEQEVEDVDFGDNSKS